MAKVLVTGGAGFIGSHLAEELVRLGHKVTILDNLSSGKRSNLSNIQKKAKFIKGDVRNVAVLKKACKGQKYVFHLAAIASVPFSVKHPLETHEINTTGTLKVLLAAKKAKVKRVIFSSSASVYGDDPKLPKKESSNLKPLTPYALTKLAGEQCALMFNNLYGLETVALRYFNVYGPRQNPRSPYSGVITKFIDNLKRNQKPTIFGDGKQTRDFIFVSDVVQANLKAMRARKAAGKVFNIASGKKITINRMLSHLCKALNKKISAKHVKPAPGDIRHSVANISQARRILQYKPKIAFKDGIIKTIES